MRAGQNSRVAVFTKGRRYPYAGGPALLNPKRWQAPARSSGTICRACRQPGLTEIHFMRIGMLIWRTIVNFAKQVWLLPRNVSIAVEEKRRQDTGRVSEAERLDRIRNPSKYAGR